MNRKKIIIIVLLVLFCILGGGIAAYVQDYYHADQYAKTVLEQDIEKSMVVQEKDNQIYFLPDEAVAGLIFYPGAKVEYTAYVPLMSKLAEQGVLCVLIRMPANIAILDQNAADGVMARFPYVDDWYMSGHSLGGAMAANYASKHAQEYKGLVLLASYSIADLSNTDLKVLSVFGSEDLVINKENYEKNIVNLPSGFLEYEISGGCHAYFGSYGFQDGDGTPTISNEEQLDITVQQIIEFMGIER